MAALPALELHAAPLKHAHTAASHARHIQPLAPVERTREQITGPRQRRRRSHSLLRREHHVHPLARRRADHHGGRASGCRHTWHHSHARGRRVGLIAL